MFKDRGMRLRKYTWHSPTPAFACFFYVKMNQFEAHLIVSSRVRGSKVPRMAIQFEYFFWQKRQNGECNVKQFTRFLFGMRPDVPVFKVLVLTSDLVLNWSKYINISSRHCSSNFAHSFDFHLRKISICRRWFLFGVNYKSL